MDIGCRIELFGELRVVQGDRVLTRFRTHKAALLLGYLALHLRQSHPRDQLVDLFWPEMEPEAGRDNLSTALSALRRQLEPAPTPRGALLRADRQFVQLNPEAVTTDVAEFDHLLHAAARRADAAERAGLLEQAVGLYRGELLPGCLEEWALLEQSRCRERSVDALEQWAAALEERGELEGALAAARRAAAADPYREEPRQAQMRLYAALGRTAAVRETYRELERVLKTELGIAPAPATRELSEQLTQNPPALPARRPAPAPPPERRPPPAAAPEPGSREPSAPLSSPVLPIQFTRFIGREAEMARLTSLLAEPDARLVTLTGPGGAGKTRLAIEVARQVAPAFAGRVWFVELAALPDAHLIPFALASTLKLAPASDQGPLESVTGFLAGAPALLLLDNFEHLLRENGTAKDDRPGGAGAPALVRLLLERVPGLTCLVTSRRPLHLGGEHEFAVPPLTVPVESSALSVERPTGADSSWSELSTPDSHLSTLSACPSVALYVDRAQQVRPDFALTRQNAAAVTTLCRLLEGMPLAIEMAAAWAKTLPPARVLERLEGHWEMLVSRRRDRPSRHQSMRATIDWSYALLTPDQQACFAQLSVFRGGWTLDAAEAVCADSGLPERPFTAAAPRAAEKDRPEGGVPLRPGYPPQGGWTESPRLCGDGGAGPIQNPKSKIQNSEVLGLLTGLVDQSLVLLEETDEEERYRLLEPLREYAGERLAEAGQAEAVRGRHAAYFLTLAEAGAPELDGPQFRRWLDCFEREYDNLRTALEWYQQRETGVEDGLRLAAALHRFWELSGRLQERRRWLESTLARSSQRTTARARALLAAAILDREMKEDVRGESRFQESLAIMREQGDRRGAVEVLINLAEMATLRSGPDAAQPLYEEGLAIAREAGDRWMGSVALQGLGHLAVRRGNEVEARALWEECLALRREAGVMGGFALWLLGNLAHDHGDETEARRYWREYLMAHRGLGSVLGVAEGLGWLAETAVADGAAERGARLWAAAMALHESLGRSLSPFERAPYERDLIRLREALGDEALAMATARGRRLTLEEAIAYATGEPGAG